MARDPLRESFDRAVRAYAGDLHRYAYRLCRDRVMAEDLVQETFTRAWKAWQSLRSSVSAKYWFLSILRRENARRCSRPQLQLVAEDSQFVELAAATGGSVIELQQLIERLPHAYRVPLVMHVVDGLTCREIARELNTTEGAVMTRLARAREALRSHLDGNAPDAA